MNPDVVTPLTAAQTAAEAARTLNHLTIATPSPGRTGWEGVADVYGIIAELQVLAARLPQAYAQLAQTFADPATPWRADNDTDPASLIGAARDGLGDAAVYARTLADALERAHSAISHLHIADPTNAERRDEAFQREIWLSVHPPDIDDRPAIEPPTREE